MRFDGQRAEEQLAGYLVVRQALGYQSFGDYNWWLPRPAARVLRVEPIRQEVVRRAAVHRGDPAID